MLGARDWDELLEPYFAEYGSIGTGPEARGPQLFQVDESGRMWRVRQVLADPAGDHGWSIDAVVDLDESDALGEIVFDDLTVTAG